MGLAPDFRRIYMPLYFPLSIRSPGVSDPANLLGALAEMSTAIRLRPFDMFKVGFLVYVHILSSAQLKLQVFHSPISPPHQWHAYLVEILAGVYMVAQATIVMFIAICESAGCDSGRRSRVEEAGGL
jgi:hypothetical protein